MLNMTDNALPAQKESSIPDIALVSTLHTTRKAFTAADTEPSNNINQTLRNKTSEKSGTVNNIANDVFVEVIRNIQTPATVLGQNGPVVVI